MSAIPEPVNAVLQAQQQAVRNQVAVTVERKRLDAVEQQGDALIGLIESTAALIPSPDAAIGRQLDTRG